MILWTCFAATVCHIDDLLEGSIISLYTRQFLNGHSTEYLHLSPSSAWTEDKKSLESGMDYELPTSERSSHDDKASEELLTFM